MKFRDLLCQERWRWIVAGYVAAVGTGVVFALALHRAGDWTRGLRWERDLLLGIHAHEVPRWVDALFLTVPWLGTNITLIPIVLVAAVWLWWRRDRADLALHLLVVQAGSYSMNPLVKMLFERPRPELWERRGQFAWAAYPSGHAIASVAVLFTIAYLLHRERKWQWPYFVAAALLVMSLYSRLYLGVHWPTDVIAGFAMGLVWLAFSAGALISGKRHWERRLAERRDGGGDRRDGDRRTPSSEHVKIA